MANRRDDRLGPGSPRPPPARRPDLAGLAADPPAIPEGQRDGEREALIRSLDAERAWLRTVIEVSPVGMILVEGANGRRIVANARTERLFGRSLTPEGGIGQYIGQILLPDGTPRPVEDLAVTRALHGQTIAREEEILRHPDGTGSQVLVSAVPIVTSGTISGAVVIYEDITSLRESERLRVEWTSIVAHELRQPIAIILGYVSLLERRLRPDATSSVQRALDNVLVASRNLNRMIGDLLEASRLEARRLKLQRETVDLAALVGAIVGRARPMTPGHAIRLEVQGTIPPTCVDPARIEQVVGNLLSNAAKYSYPRSEIVVSVARRGDDAVISVADQGEGIKPADVGKLFTRFHRTASAAAGKVGGLGLGLYVTRGLVEAHGGRISVESIPGQTTTFHVTLPIVAPCPDEVSPPGETASQRESAH
jgi:PAS domain S-box-containing protein